MTTLRVRITLTSPTMDTSKAKPTYSMFRTTILKLTPGEMKCKLYCRGKECKYCVPNAFPAERQAVRGLYSTWVTDQILAMARPLQQHFDEYKIIQQFKAYGIRSVFNLEEPMEHCHCGPPLLPSGFSYDPEEFMKNDVFYYNFPFPDFQATTSAFMLDVVKVVSYALTQGKIAIHCHAGHGRTGMLIAALFVYRDGLRPAEAVRIVRSKRPQSVQSHCQVTLLNNMQRILLDGQCLPVAPYKNIQEAIQHQNEFLAGAENRMYTHIPKVMFVLHMRLLSIFYGKVSFAYRTADKGQFFFDFVLENPLRPKYDERSLTTFVMNLLERRIFTNFTEWYEDRTTHHQMSLVNMEKHVQDCNLQTSLCFLDAYMKCFAQLYTEQRLQEVVSCNGVLSVAGEREVIILQPSDWCLLFSIHCFASILSQFHPELTLLLAQWFTASASVSDSTADVLLKLCRQIAKKLI